MADKDQECLKDIGWKDEWNDDPNKVERIVTDTKVVTNLVVFSLFSIFLDHSKILTVFKKMFPLGIFLPKLPAFKKQYNKFESSRKKLSQNHKRGTQYVQRYKDFTSEPFFYEQKITTSPVSGPCGSPGCDVLKL